MPGIGDPASRPAPSCPAVRASVPRRVGAGGQRDYDSRAMVLTRATPPGAATAATGQQIRFCLGGCRVRLPWARHGTGPPLIAVSCWLSHLQHDWQSPVWRHFLDDLGEISTLVRYDERGFGMSDWNVTDFSLDARVGD